MDNKKKRILIIVFCSIIIIDITINDHIVQILTHSQNVNNDKYQTIGINKERKIFLFVCQPETQLLKPHSIHKLQPSVIINLALHVGQVLSSFDSSSGTCVSLLGVSNRIDVEIVSVGISSSSILVCSKIFSI